MQWPEHFGVCFKDKVGRVLEQNPYCLQTCGDQQFKICRKGCMLLRTPHEEYPILQDGMQVYRRTMIEGQPHDVLLIDDDSGLVSILYPLKRQLFDEKDFLHKYGLSHREQEIAALILAGKTNEDIATNLHIALSTLKTHINNIYRKLPDGVVRHLKKRPSRK